MMRDLALLLVLIALANTSGHAGPAASPLGAHNEASILALTDWSAILRTWRFKGICVCGDLIPRFGPRTENAFPTGIVEAVKQPGATYLATAVTAATKAAAKAVLSSSHSGKGLGESGTQFLEAHAYGFPLGNAWVNSVTPGICFPYGPKPPGIDPLYYSELDQLAWRTGTGDLLDAASALSFYADAHGGCAAAALPGMGALSGLFCAGLWGPLYPRRGFITQHSEVIAAHLAAVRALHVANAPTGRIVTNWYWYPTLQGHYWQMLEPVWRPAYQIGQGVASTEAAATSPRGGYLFIHMPILGCCSPCYPSHPMPPRSIDRAF